MGCVSVPRTRSNADRTRAVIAAPLRGTGESAGSLRALVTPRRPSSTQKRPDRLGPGLLGRRLCARRPGPSSLGPLRRAGSRAVVPAVEQVVRDRHSPVRQLRTVRRSCSRPNRRPWTMCRTWAGLQLAHGDARNPRPRVTAVGWPNVASRLASLLAFRWLPAWLRRLATMLTAGLGLLSVSVLAVVSEEPQRICGDVLRQCRSLLPGI